MNIYKVSMAKLGNVFLVKAEDESKAARLAEKQWEDWGYSSSDGKAISVVLEAFGDQYPPADDIPWFIE